MLRSTLCFLALGFSLASNAAAVDIYFTGSDHNIRRITPAGVITSTIPVPFGDSSQATGEPRGTVVGRDGRIHVFNGLFQAYLSTFNPTSNTWSHPRSPGMGTTSIQYYGTVAAAGKYVFFPDMDTFNGAEEGLIRFNLETAAAEIFTDYIANPSGGSDLEAFNVTYGQDLLLYVLCRAGGTEGTHILAYDPASMQRVKTLTSTIGLRGIAVDSNGDIYGTSSNAIRRFNSSMTLLDSRTLTSGLLDIDLALDGTIAVGAGQQGIHLLDRTLDFHTTLDTGDFNGEFVTFAQSIPEPTMGLLLLAAPLLLRRPRHR
jgi:hypothetical protein